MTASIGELPLFTSANNADVCNWFFATFALVSLYMGFILVMNILRISFIKVPVMVKVVLLVLSIAATGVVVGNAGFQFTMCKRALSV